MEHGSQNNPDKETPAISKPPSSGESTFYEKKSILDFWKITKPMFWRRFILFFPDLLFFLVSIAYIAVNYWSSNIDNWRIFDFVYILDSNNDGYLLLFLFACLISPSLYLTYTLGLVFIKPIRTVPAWLFGGAISIITFLFWQEFQSSISATVSSDMNRILKEAAGYAEETHNTLSNIYTVVSLIDFIPATSYSLYILITSGTFILILYTLAVGFTVLPSHYFSKSNFLKFQVKVRGLYGKGNVGVILVKCLGCLLALFILTNVGNVAHENRVSDKEYPHSVFSRGGQYIAKLAIEKDFIKFHSCGGEVIGHQTLELSNGYVMMAYKDDKESWNFKKVLCE